MMWLTWRQLRANLIVIGVGALALGLAAALTGPHLADVYAESADTFLAWVATQNVDQQVYIVGMAAGYVVPAIVGAFWGAPMIARELEAGTHRLAWTQGVTRTRWLATKLGLGLLVASAVAGLISLGMTWWAHPIDQAVAAGSSDPDSIFSVGRILPVLFASRGIAPIGYAVFAFVLGILAGAMIRRTVPAMAVTLAVYTALQIVMPMWIRPHLVEPVDKIGAITADNLHGIRGHGPRQIDELDVEIEVPAGWTLSTETVDAAGKTVDTIPSWVVQCLPGPGEEQPVGGGQIEACFDRLADEGYRQEVVVQPAGHYWALQWRETGLLFGGAALLAGACFWRVRRLS